MPWMELEPITFALRHIHPNLRVLLVQWLAMLV